MTGNTTAIRRIVRANRLTAELGHDDILSALQHAEEMRSALKVIYTWAGIPGALDPQHVRDLAAKALGIARTQEKPAMQHAQQGEKP